MLAISPENIPRLAETSLDLRVAGFALLVSLLTAVTLRPGACAARSEIRSSHDAERGRAQRAASSRSRLRQSLVTLEMAMAVVLLVAAGLLIRSVWNLQSVEMGFRPDHLLTMRLTPRLRLWRQSADHRPLRKIDRSHQRAARRRIRRRDPPLAGQRRRRRHGHRDRRPPARREPLARIRAPISAPSASIIFKRWACASSEGGCSPMRIRKA